MHVEGHQERFPPLPLLYRPRNPSSLALLAQHTCPLAPLLHPSLITTPPAFPLDPPLLHNHSQNFLVQGFSRACVRLYGSKMAPLSQEKCPQHSSHTTHLSPLPLHSPRDPLVLHNQSQNFPFQGFFGACMGSCGSKMAQISLKPLV